MASTESWGILANLSVQQGPLAGQQFSVTQPSVTIGRAAGNDIVINDLEVSRHHARLTWDGQQFIIEDLGSTNGTFVNGVRITAPQPVSSGAALRLGALDVSFQSSLVAGGVDPITNVNMPAPQPPAPVAGSPISAPVPPPVRGSTPWLLILGGGAVLFLALVAVIVAAVYFLGPGSSAPATTITAPLDGSEVTVAGEVPVIAMVNDEGGITRVELWVNGGLQDTVDSAGPPGQTGFPVQFQWTPSHEGSHMLEVRPYSRNGQSGEPASVVVHAIPGDGAATAAVLVVPIPTGQGGFLFLQDTPDPGPASGTAGCTSDAVFVSDVTIPHYTEIPAGQSFDKTWRIRNSGTCPWDFGYQLAYANGDLMNAPPSQAVSSTSPGGTADVRVTMYAPGAPGTYKGIWQMTNASGERFGPTVTVVIQVRGAETTGGTWTRPADGMEMVYVPGGEFQMGSTDEQVDQPWKQCKMVAPDCSRERFEDEQPAHTVALNGFWLDRTEVTNAQYRQCVAAGVCSTSKYSDDSNYNGEDQPVVGVDWGDARTYCQWAGARLPTEAEWEYAARGPEGRVYPWGDTFDPKRANTRVPGDGYGEKAAPVGNYPGGASWVGALDMTGNVWEWVADWYGDYPSGKQVNPTGPASGAYRGMRGGSWNDPRRNTRGANRYRYFRVYWYYNVGFRCARNS